MSRPERALLVTYELAPINRGGAGVVISALAEELIAAGWEVHVLADMPPAEVRQWRDLMGRRGHAVHAHPLSEVAPAVPLGDTIWQRKALHFREGVYALERTIGFSFIEYFEYAGVAAPSVALRARGDGMNATQVVRIHGSLGSIDQAERLHPVPADRLVMYQLETWALRLADVVLAPVGDVGRQYAEWYGIEPGRLRVSPPPIGVLMRDFVPVRATDEAHHLLFYGKLQAVKGVELFVRACLELARLRPALRFTLVGSDTNSAPGGGSMRAYLEALIGPQLTDRFRFLNHIRREELPRFAADALAAVIPSRSESFCLAAHELHHLRCPLVLSDIPAFRGIFEEERTALFCDQQLPSLVSALERLAADPGLRRRLSENRLTYQATVDAYRNLPPPRTLLDGTARFAMTQVDATGAAVPKTPPPAKPTGLRQRVAGWLGRKHP